MKRNQYRSKTIVCPFYTKEEGSVMFCKGPLPNTSTHMAFSSIKEKQKYKSERCKTIYFNCPIHKMLTENMLDE